MADSNAVDDFGVLPGNSGRVFDLDTECGISEEDQIVHLADSIIQQGIRDNASGIYIEPTSTALRIRNRVDGFLEVGWSTSKHVREMLFRRFKIMAGLNTFETSVPRNGHFTVMTDGKASGIRITFLPTYHGEKVVMRITDSSAPSLALHELGLDQADTAPGAPPPALHELGLEQTNYDTLLEWINKPSGMVIACGPGGAGKTTLLYACLNALDPKARKIVTVEDYVEYALPGVAQMLVKPSEGMTFSGTLTAALLQNPDVVLCRQMRDLETARIAVEASRSGRLLLTALNIHGAPSALKRLADMGCERSQIAAAVNGIVAGTVVRRLCDHCKAVASPDKIDPIMDDLRAGAAFGGYHLPDNATFLTAVGCGQCRNTGYKGRIGLYEVLSCNPELINQLFQCASHGEMTRAAVAHGMRTLLADGICKAAAGITAIDEIPRHIFAPALPVRTAS